MNPETFLSRTAKISSKLNNNVKLLGKNNLKNMSGHWDR